MLRTVRPGCIGLSNPVAHISSCLQVDPNVVLFPFETHDVHAAHWRVQSDSGRLSASPQQHDWVSVSLEPAADHTFWLDGKPVSQGPVQVGTVRVCPTGASVAAEFGAQSGMMNVFVIYGGPSACLTLGLPQASLEIPATGEPDAWLTAVAAAMISSSRDGGRAGSLEAGYLLLSAFAYCARRYRKQDLPIFKGGLAAWQLRRVFEMMEGETQSGGEITIERLAADVSLSPFHFIRAFKRSVGTSPHRHLTVIRLERAKTLLKDPRLPISVVAQRCGYQESGSFGRIFKQEVGLTPNEFRRQLG